MIRLLLDEHISPSIVRRFAEEGVYAQSVSHIGLSGQSDPSIWRYALDNDFTVVTTNARDFIKLLNIEIHPGLIVLREGGLTREEQWDRLAPVIEHIKASGDDDFVLNKLIEISGPRMWEFARSRNCSQRYRGRLNLASADCWPTMAAPAD